MYGRTQKNLNQVISGNFPSDELKLSYRKHAAPVQQQPWHN